MSTIRLADGHLISDYKRPYIIAEVNSSHNGNIEVAKQLIDVAVEAGCNCVKFQSWSTDSLYSRTYYKRNPLAKRFVDRFSLSPDQLKGMALYCREKGVGFSSTPYSRIEVDFLADECNVPFIKISSMEVNNPEYICYIAKKQIPIVLSTGMADYEEVKRAVEIIESTGNRNIAILHCVSIYPTPIAKTNLNNIVALRELFPQYPIGFSDHTLGDVAAVAAVALGAAVIEKHITLDAKKIGMDNQMAMEPNELKLLVEKCHKTVDMLGVRDRIVCSEEISSRENMRRSIVVTRDIKAGECLEAQDLDAKRPGTGIAPEKMSKLVGRRVNRDIESDTLIFESDLY